MDGADKVDNMDGVDKMGAVDVTRKQVGLLRPLLFIFLFIGLVIARRVPLPDRA